MTRPYPCGYDLAGRACECGDDGGPANSSRGGLCNVHGLRLARNGHPGAPGPKSDAGRRPKGPELERVAWSLLNEAPERASRGQFVVRRGGLADVAWADGTQQRLPWPVLDGWRRRGWLGIGPWQRKGAPRELVILKGARAAARELLRIRAENRVRWAQRVGLGEA